MLPQSPELDGFLPLPQALCAKLVLFCYCHCTAISTGTWTPNAARVSPSSLSSSIFRQFLWHNPLGTHSCFYCCCHCHRLTAHYRWAVAVVISRAVHHLCSLCRCPKQWQSVSHFTTILSGFAETIGNSQWRELVLKNGEISPILKKMENTIPMERVRSLYYSTMDDLKWNN